MAAAAKTVRGVELVAAFTTAADATAAALRLVRAYGARGDAHALAAKHTEAVAHAVAAARGGGGGAPMVVVADIDDTLIHMHATHFSANAAVVALFHALLAAGAAVHLVTARSADADTARWTRDQLAALGVSGYASLHFAPERARRSLAAVSVWKRAVRKRIAEHNGAPIVLTVGDQWGDSTPLDADADIDALDAAFGVATTPWLLIRPNDGVSLWGLKLESLP